MFKHNLLLVYRRCIAEGGPKSDWIAQYLEFDGSNTSLSHDDSLNEPRVYDALFSEEGKHDMAQLFLDLLQKMNGIPYEHCTDVLDALAVFQYVAALALWKYHKDVGKPIESFTREFDRIDVQNERIRLYELAQQTPSESITTGLFR